MRVLALLTVATLLVPFAANAGEDCNCPSVVTLGDSWRIGNNEDFASVGAALFDVLNNTDGKEEVDTYSQFKVDYRARAALFGIGPMVGVDFDVEGGAYYYGGVYAPFYYDETIVITPSFAAGVYDNNDSADLGGPLEFRSSIEVGYKFENNMTFSVGFNHYSNAGTYDENPGVETAYASLSVPLGWSLY